MAHCNIMETMVSQALYMIPRNQVQSFNPVKNLGFSAFLSRAASPLTTSKVSVSGFHSKIPVGSSFSSSAISAFVVRAETDPEREAEASENDAEEAETKVEDGAEGEDEAEEKPKEPRKHRIKLGDIIRGH